jgi:hypothetical protein
MAEEAVSSLCLAEEAVSSLCHMSVSSLAVSSLCHMAEEAVAHMRSTVAHMSEPLPVAQQVLAQLVLAHMRSAADCGRQ